MSDNGNGNKDDFNFDTLLDVDGDLEQTLGDKDDKKSDDPKNPDDISKLRSEIEKKDEKIDKLMKSYKDQTEFLRQSREEIKDLKEFKDRLFGKSDEEKNKMMAEELRKKYEEDPQEYIEQRIDEKLKSLQDIENKINVTNARIEAEKLMSDIDRDDKYERIDWDAEYPKIISKLKHFSDESKKTDPKGTLLAACQLAGVLKPRDKDKMPPYIEGVGSQISESVKKEAESIKEKILNSGRKPIFPK